MTKYKKDKPTSVLYVKDEENPLVLNAADGTPMIFKNYSLAKRFVMRNVEPNEREFIRFVNSAVVDPV